jgi:hypothetical protein
MNRKYKGNYSEGEDMLWKIAAKAFVEISNAGVHALYALEHGKCLARTEYTMLYCDFTYGSYAIFRSTLGRA